MARQTPQQKRANAAHARNIEKSMGRPESLYKKKETKKSPVSTPMLLLLAFVVAGTLGLGFSEIGGAVLAAVADLLRRVGILSKY